MSTTNVADIVSVQDLLDDPRCVERLAGALHGATRPESAEEFISDLPLRMRLAAVPAQKLGEQLGLQSRTDAVHPVSSRYGYVLLGLLCGIVSQSVELNQVEERKKAEDCLIVGTVPSSALSMEGEISVHVLGRQGEYRLECTVIFKGQKFAWGRGKRMLKKLFQDLDREVGDYERERL